MSGDPTARLLELVRRCEAGPEALADRESGDGLAEQLGGEVALRWRVAVVRALMVDPPDGDAVREAYGELVDHYREDEAAFAIVRPLGDEIRRREAEGSLPSVLVARSNRRPNTNNG